MAVCRRQAPQSCPEDAQDRSTPGTEPGRLGLCPGPPTPFHPPSSHPCPSQAPPSIHRASVRAPNPVGVWWGQGTHRQGGKLRLGGRGSPKACGGLTWLQSWMAGFGPLTPPTATQTPAWLLCAGDGSRAQSAEAGLEMELPGRQPLLPRP